MAETGYEVSDGMVVRFEFEPDGEGFEQARVPDVAGLLAAAVEPVIVGAKTVLARLEQVAPQKVEVTFGLKATGRADFIVAKAASEANFSVTVTWEPGTRSA